MYYGHNLILRFYAVKYMQSMQNQAIKLLGFNKERASSKKVTLVVAYKQKPTEIFQMESYNFVTLELVCQAFILLLPGYQIANTYQC